MHTKTAAAVLAGCALALVGCQGTHRQAEVKIDSGALAMFAPLPEVMASPDNLITEAKIDLGRALYFEKRLSKDNSVSCNDCHDLNRYGADTGNVSEGVGGALGGRNSPTVYNAAGHVAQFWDGRAANVEEQAKGPILNPVEMAMPSDPAVMKVLAADAKYRAMFKAAFPDVANPMTYDNLGKAVGAFERKLVTPSRWDRFLQGEDSVLTSEEQAGFNTFVSVGCAACHNGAYVGGGTFQKAGAVNPWPDTSDVGREGVTHQAADRMVFKVPSLRNVERTGPYFHDGKVVSLDSALTTMAHAQLGKQLTPEQVGQITAWLKTLTGEIPTDYIASPGAGR
jgi:cytochrome c peroxidase